MLPVMEGRDAQGNLVRVHMPISFKLLKEFKTACEQYSPEAPFMQMFLGTRAQELCPLESVGQNLPVRSRLSLVEN